MKSALLIAFTCCSMVGLATGATIPKKKIPVAAKKTGVAAKAAATVAHAGGKPVATRTAAARATGVRTTAVSARGRRRSTTVRPARVYTPRQVTPTQDRYREIQDALYAKGYLTTPAKGVWDQESVDSLRRFQQDQKLEPSGKLTARSLMALGLGSRTSAEAPSPNPSTTLNKFPADPSASR